jgi:hypothetical protein
MGKTFPAKLFQDLLCDMDIMGVGIVVKKDHFLCQQASTFHPDGFLQEPQYCEVVICIHHYPVVQILKENALHKKMALTTPFSVPRVH